MGLVVARGGFYRWAGSIGRESVSQERGRRSSAKLRSKQKTQMSTNTIKRPKIVSQEEWLAARKKLLAKEKQLTHERDAIAAERRQLPWGKVENDYVFDSGPISNLLLNGPARENDKGKATLCRTGARRK